MAFTSLKGDNNQVQNKTEIISRLLRWMDDLQSYDLFNNISSISGQWEGDSERLHAMEYGFRSKGFPPLRFKLRTAKSAEWNFNAINYKDS